MTSISDKVDYVKRQGQTRNHHCHWPGCTRQVPPALWGCRGHWYTLPAELRTRIWRTYKPGQEVKGTPSAAYVEVAQAVQEWIAQHEASKAPKETPAAPASEKPLPHEFDDDACCIHCGFDGAEWHHWKNHTWEGKGQPDAKPPLCVWPRHLRESTQ